MSGKTRRAHIPTARAGGATGRGTLPGCAGVPARAFACGAAFAGRGAPTRQRSRGWRRAGETPAHPSGPRLRRDRARRTSRVRGRPRPRLRAGRRLRGGAPQLASVRADGDVRARRPRTQAVRAFGATGRGGLPGCAGVPARTFARGAAFAGRGAPTCQRLRGWRRAGETPAHPGSPRLRRDQARRTSRVCGRPRPHVCVRGGPTRQRLRGWRRAGGTPAHPGGLRRGGVIHGRLSWLRRRGS